MAMIWEEEGLQTCVKSKIYMKSNRWIGNYAPSPESLAMESESKVV